MILSKIANFHYLRNIPVLIDEKGNAFAAFFKPPTINGKSYFSRFDTKVKSWSVPQTIPNSKNRPFSYVQDPIGNSVFIDGYTKNELNLLRFNAHTQEFSTPELFQIRSRTIKAATNSFGRIALIYNEPTGLLMHKFHVMFFE